MNVQSISNEEAQAIDAMMPGNQEYGVGSRLQNALSSLCPTFNKKWYVDKVTGSDSGRDGLSRATAFKTIQKAIDSAAAFDRICVIQNLIAAGGTDPVDYPETLIIPATKPFLQLVGISVAPVQGGVPQIKKGSGSTALLTIRAPGCWISGLGFNGSGSTGGGILLDDDGSTKSAFGTVITGCHFKNCKGSTATDATTGGAIQWSSSGGAWQVRISGNRFFKNVGDIVLLGTGGSVPQDVVIENNIFSDPAANVDCNLYLAGGSGMIGLVVRGNIFPALPAIGSGAVVRFADLTGCSGIFTHNYFGDTTTATGYGAAKTKAKIPTTVFMPHNYNESGLITREA